MSVEVSLLREDLFLATSTPNLPGVVGGVITLLGGLVKATPARTTGSVAVPLELNLDPGAMEADLCLDMGDGV